ncbi:MAG TPA: helix-turn-helix transcriptional regulator [Bacillus sp. (in: firmicutes)]|uniref:helix-turn-helix domain-containing protein n=1 Tax=Bacillus litorisediminis TaxID=2922713 RepID=UPI001FAE9E0E|nr:helix-turn-helix transcriptional regulator [Bacillus litorisediminis]HWO74376.1 helix-turn-helix transcriptional regulator [Bacillus sp. (in: firmicutes)]
MFTAESLKQYRQSLRLSRRSFAEITGYTEAYIYMLETNRKPMSMKASNNIMTAIERYADEARKLVKDGGG